MSERSNLYEVPPLKICGKLEKNANSSGLPSIFLCFSFPNLPNVLYYKYTHAALLKEKEEERPKCFASSTTTVHAQFCSQSPGLAPWRVTAKVKGKLEPRVLQGLHKFPSQELGAREHE